MTALRPRIVVLTTGGTIASRDDGTGAAIASVGGADLVDGVERQRTDADISVETREVLLLGSYLLGLSELDRLRDAVRDALADPAVTGVVITHGTDTIEETAIAIDLDHTGARPVVITGAQHAADSDEPDGPGNLRDALDVAADPSSRDRGVLVVFAGRIHRARGVRKEHTLALDAFAGARRPVGTIRAGRVRYSTAPSRDAVHEPVSGPLGGQRVPVVDYSPGDDATLVDAALSVSTGGIVLVATGAGNSSPAVVAAVGSASSRGLVVALATRVPYGPVTPIYGGGGGVDLVAAGAVPTGRLRPSQARIALAAALTSAAPRSGPAQVREHFLRSTTLTLD